MVWHFLRYIISFTLPIFYKRIQGKNIRNLHYKRPMIIAMNHPNAFMDPVAITWVAWPAKTGYLARGDAFKPGLVSFFLESLGIVPIFRIQDAGKEGLQKNDEAYRRVNQLLSRNKKIIVFAEGLCIQERRLRPLKKGVSRMVFGAYEYLGNDELLVLPVGVNYSQPDKWRSTLFYNVGEPIPVREFYAAYTEHPARAHNQFLQHLEKKMKDLVTHINNPAYDRLVPWMEELLMDRLLKEQGKRKQRLEDVFGISRQLTDRVNRAEKENPAALDEFKNRASYYFSELRKEGLRDWLIDPARNRQASPFRFILRSLFMLVTFPFYLTGLIGNYLPYKGSEWITRKVLKANKEFYASIALGVGTVLFLLTYIFWFVLVYAFSEHILWPLLVCMGFIVCGWFTIFYYFFMLKTLGIFRYLRNQKTVKTLMVLRTQLMDLVNKF